MKKTIANKGDRPNALTGRTVRRIARAVNAYERGDRNLPGRGFKTGGLGFGDNLRLGKTSAEWDVGDAADVDIWEDGDPGSETQTEGETVEAINLLRHVAEGRWVLLGKAENDGWYLVASDMPPVMSGEFTQPWEKNETATVTVTIDDAEFTVDALNQYVTSDGDAVKRCTVAWDGTQYVLIALEC